MHVSKNSSTVSSVSDRPVSKVAEKENKKNLNQARTGRGNKRFLQSIRRKTNS